MFPGGVSRSRAVGPSQMVEASPVFGASYLAGPCQVLCHPRPDVDLNLDKRAVRGSRSKRGGRSGEGNDRLGREGIAEIYSLTPTLPLHP
jgi:hypothetical protein